MTGTRTQQSLLKWSLIFSFGLEALTLLCRLVSSSTGAAFAEKYGVPGWLRIHHFWWGLLLIGASSCFSRYSRTRFWILSFGIGVFFSDWLHHLVFSPIFYGNMSWHWP
ncbi:MAG: hypothetical protein ABGX07_00045 [Pirellulaceae bacterium]|nr:hypothetical protein [Planctomycetaceae bacterium]HIM28245.1 hypothetical protein [Planctomycetota bacterium]